MITTSARGVAGHGLCGHQSRNCRVGDTRMACQNYDGTTRPDSVAEVHFHIEPQQLLGAPRQ